MLTDEQRFALRQQHAIIFGSLKAIAELVHTEVTPVVQAASKSSALDETVFGLFLRALGWAYSLKRLDDVFDFQAHSAGCRSLFEVAIDLVLLTRGVEPVEKLLAWERVATYRSAEFRARADGGDAAVTQEAAGHVQRNAAAVEADRARFWPQKNGYPQRWTGRPLFPDAQRAHAREPSIGLGALARDHYDRLCWGTHGSGLVLIRTVTEDLFPGISILAIYESTNLLRHVVRLVLEHFKLYGPNWEDRLASTHGIGMLDGLRRTLDQITALDEGSET